MSASIPSAAEVRRALLSLTSAQLRRLAEVSAVPFTTLWKVRSGETSNPGVETVRKFLPHVGCGVVEAKVELIGTPGAPPVSDNTLEARDAA